MYIKRSIEERIKKYLWQKKVIIIYGARRTGKTTLVKKIQEENKLVKSLYLNCDESDILEKLNKTGTSYQLRELIGEQRLVIIDEAQRVENIGLKLKLLVDELPQIQVIATGSSSFELSDKIIEPLTGRNWEFHLYPFTLSELKVEGSLMLDRLLPSILIYGNYPEVINETGEEKKLNTIKSIAENYLYKDVLKFQNLRNAEKVNKLLQALALQVGNEVSYNEISSLLGLSKETIALYIEILIKAFVIFKLPPFSKNLRKELSKMRKIYFFDNGVRNALIKNFNRLDLRDDIGKLWENFILAEFMKRSFNLGFNNSYYFWRTYDGQEIDLVEEQVGKLNAYEIKWGKARKQAPKAWRETYKEASWQVVSRNNFFKLLKVK